MQNSLFWQKNKNFLTKEALRVGVSNSTRGVNSVNRTNMVGSAASNASPIGKRAFLGILLAGFIAAVLFTLVLSPQAAYAKSYEMPEVTIDAVVQDNGNLQVTEKRTFTFDGTFSALWWEFEKIPSYASLQVNSVSLEQAGTTNNLSSVPFVLSWRDAGGPSHAAYSLDSPKNTVYVFFSASDETVTIELTYTIVDLVSVYQDTAELYWQIVGSSWAADSENVSMNITLPVPANSSVVPGENVRAWGHGPLDSSIGFQDDGTIHYSIPRVSSGHYAEARVVFPTSWMTGVKATDANAQPNQSMLDSILSEEQQWSDDANAQRMWSLVALLLAILVSLAACVWAVWNFIRYGKELKPQFIDEYWRDEPVLGEHPAVIGRLCRFDKEESSDFTVTIMHLANEGALLINKGEYPRGKKVVQDYYITRVDSYIPHSEIDRKALSILFDDIAGGNNTLWLASIKQYAKSNPAVFAESMQTWQGLVSAQTIQGEYFESYSKSKKFTTLGVAGVLFVLCLCVAVIFENFLVLIPGIIAGVVVAVLAHFMERRTQKGADAYARCKALEKWLTEFSSLDERPVLDLKVWGKFMVYAYLFGVADKAIKELRSAIPELFASDEALMNESPYYVPWWLFYSSSYSRHALLPSFAASFDSAVVSSVQAVSSAIDGGFSSGGGFGGGFSGGGGGGFGGGGGAR